MGLPVNDKNKKLGGGASKGNSGASKFIAKPTSTKASGVSKKPIKTGGARGS